MNKKKVLILGATGFIGRNLVEHFSKNSEYDVYATCWKRDPFGENINWNRVDLTKAEDVEKVIPGMDIVIQAAATTSGSKDIANKPYLHVTDNAVMNSHILRSCFDHKVKKFVFYSCTVMYQSSDTPIAESDFNPSNDLLPHYFGVGHTKLYVEKMCEFYSRISPTEFVVLRNSNVYGPHDKYDLEKSHVFGATITKVLTNKDGKLPVWGDGSEVRDFVYVEDLVRRTEELCLRDTGPIIIANNGSGESTTISNLVEMIIDESGKDMTIEYSKDTPSFKNKAPIDVEKLNGILENKETTSLKDGISKTITWYRENIEAK
jgi:GDP-L-fucose synthase